MVKIYNKKHNDAPDGAIYVGRPSAYGNPFTVHEHGLQGAIELHEQAVNKEITRDPLLLTILKFDLKDKDLICWCAPPGGIEHDVEPKICHAQTLAILANR